MFELHITCTKDIDKIKIDFSDGTTVCTEANHKKSTEKDVKKQLKKEQNICYNNDVDWSKYDNSDVTSTVIKPIELPDISDRPVKVDPILQELNF